MIDVELQTENNTMTDAAAELLKRNIIFFCNTPRGSLPQMRDFGFDFSVFDEPFPIFRMKATVDILSGIRAQYGIQPKTIDITADGNGGVKLKISI